MNRPSKMPCSNCVGRKYSVGYQQDCLIGGKSDSLRRHLMSEEEKDEVDISSCVFTVKDPDGVELLVTPDYKRAFQLKQFHPDSTVHVAFTLDVGMDMDPKLLKQLLSQAAENENETSQD